MAPLANTLPFHLPEPTPVSNYSLPRLPYLRLRCTLRALEPVRLPPFKGSLLRGAFGHAFRRMTCTMGRSQSCPDCLLRHGCLYTRVFETLIEGETPPFLKGLPTSPRPYVFEPSTTARDFAPGDPLDFDFLLFGQATGLRAHALLAIERMAKNGLGANRAPFRLDGVTCDGQDVYNEGRISPKLGTLAPQFPAADPIPDRIVLRFLTPTRIQGKGQLLRQPSFRALVFVMLRRTLEQAWFHLPGADLDWSFRPLLLRASEIKVTAADLRWHAWQRYSNRQGRKIDMGGFEGTLELEGDLAPFGPLLRTAEVLHVGKGATLGLGRVEVVE